MGRTQIILIALFYAMSSAVTSGRIKKWIVVKRHISEVQTGEVSIRELLFKVLTGIAGMLAIDLLSRGNPVWPSLGLLAGFIGEIYPWAKVNHQTDIGMVYFGALFYLYPVTAVASLGVSWPNLLLGKDVLLTIMIWTSAIPVLFTYSAVNPWLLAATIAVELLTIIYFRKTVWQRLTRENK